MLLLLLLLLLRSPSQSRAERQAWCPIACSMF